MGSRKFKKGGPKFVQLHHSLMSEWSRLGLSCGARALHVELMRRYNGGNNGQIYLPTREAAEALGVSRNTIGRYYSELTACGFIVETKAAHLGVDGKGRSSEWRLTHLPCDGRAPSADYRKTESLHQNRATPARKPSQGDEKGEPHLAQKPCQGERVSLHQNRANLTSSHRQRVLAVAEMREYFTANRGLCGLAHGGQR